MVSAVEYDVVLLKDGDGLIGREVVSVTDVIDLWVEAVDQKLGDIIVFDQDRATYD